MKSLRWRAWVGETLVESLKKGDEHPGVASLGWRAWVTESCLRAWCGDSGTDGVESLEKNGWTYWVGEPEMESLRRRAFGGELKN